MERDPAACNALHLRTLGQQSYLLPHAEEVCRELSRSHKLYLVTNAVASVISTSYFCNGFYSALTPQYHTAGAGR